MATPGLSPGRITQRCAAVIAWTISVCVIKSEDRFVMVQPDGWSNLFVRGEPGGMLLNGSAGWKGEIKGETITA